MPRSHFLALGLALVLMLTFYSAPRWCALHKCLVKAIPVGVVRRRLLPGLDVCAAEDDAFHLSSEPEVGVGWFERAAFIERLKLLRRQADFKRSQLS